MVPACRGAVGESQWTIPSITMRSWPLIPPPCYGFAYGLCRPVVGSYAALLRVSTYAGSSCQTRSASCPKMACLTSSHLSWWLAHFFSVHPALPAAAPTTSAHIACQFSPGENTGLMVEVDHIFLAHVVHVILLSLCFYPHRFGSRDRTRAVFHPAHSQARETQGPMPIEEL